MLELDGFAVLREIGDHPEAFGGIGAVVAKVARELVVKRLKLKSLTVQEARAVRDAVGSDAFGAIIAGLNTANLKSIVAKLDKHHPELKGSTAEWQRQHLTALLEGVAEPVQKSAKPKKAAAQPKAPAVPIGFRTEAMSVFRESLKRK
jgi:hypothetical protein